MDLFGLIHEPKLGTLVEVDGPLSVHKHKKKKKKTLVAVKVFWPHPTKFSKFLKGLFPGKLLGTPGVS